MEQHPNAKLTPKGRETLVSRIESGLGVAEAARQMGISRQTAGKWLRGVTVNIVCATFANLFRQACQCKCAMCANAFPPIPAWLRFRYRSLLFSAGKSLSL